MIIITANPIFPCHPWLTHCILQATSSIRKPVTDLCQCHGGDVSQTDFIVLSWVWVVLMTVKPALEGPGHVLKSLSALTRTRWQSNPGNYLHIEGWTKWPFYRRHFQTHFPEENICIMIHISLNAVSMGTTVHTSALVQIMDCCLTCNKLLREPTLVKMSCAIWHKVVSWCTKCESKCTEETWLWHRNDNMTPVSKYLYKRYLSPQWLNAFTCWFFSSKCMLEYYIFIDPTQPLTTWKMIQCSDAILPVHGII